MKESGSVNMLSNIIGILIKEYFVHFVHSLMYLWKSTCKCCVHHHQYV